MSVKAYGAADSAAPLIPMEIERRAPRDNDVKIDITYCGVCHSDIHTAHNDWKNAVYPVIPGHEIVGKVVEVGGAVTKFKTGDIVGVGCMVDSCLNCEACTEGDEQHCHSRATMTYGSPDKVSGGHTHGGYSQAITVREEFVLHIPDNLDLKAVPPLLCAGITTYSPLKHFNIGKGHKVGVIGLGGLGHLGVKFAKALGAEVTVLSRSPGKEEDARALGADTLITTDKEAFKSARGRFDFLLNTVPVPHSLDAYLRLLARNGTMAIVGAIEPFQGLHSGSLIGGRKRLVGSAIGGIAETQEMLEFASRHNIVSDIEIINMQDINRAWERVMAADVRYRFVIDMESLKD
jgi:uncharacterized zinc-type alcohol dehydrogenase-like protein